MKYLISLYFGLSFATFAQNAVSVSSSSKVITSDIEHFFTMLDSLSGRASTKDSLQTLRSMYLDKASIGLREYLEHEKRNGFNVEEQYMNVLRRYPKYLNSIRHSALTIPGQKPRIDRLLAKFRNLYPASDSLSVFLSIGFFNSGGKPMPSGLFIGAEIVSTWGHPDFSEWGKNSWLQNQATSTKDISGLVLHESFHTHQKFVLYKDSPLLCQALIEGGAVFIVNLLTNGHGLNRAGGLPKTITRFGRIHEAELWMKFKKDMDENGTISKWFYNTGTQELPKDTGYFIGFRICQKYYENAVDKGKAVKEIIEISDCKKFLEASSYGRFSN